MSSTFMHKVITVTGAASGMGRATAIMLAARGARVSLADIQSAKLQETVQEIEAAGGIAFGTVVDIRQRQQVGSWIGETVNRYGRLDGAANVAGVTGRDLGKTLLEDIDDADFEFVWRVNVQGTLNCMREQIRAMKASGGSIVNVSSLAGTLGLAKHGSYNASKHAVNGLSKAAAKELGPRAIRVNVVAPGTIDTPMIQAAESVSGNEYKMDVVPMKRKGTSEEIAGAIAYYLGDDSTYVSSSILNVDGGWLH